MSILIYTSIFWNAALKNVSLCQRWGEHKLVSLMKYLLDALPHGCPQFPLCHVSIFAFHSGDGGPHPLCPLSTLWSPRSPCPNPYVLWDTVQGFALPRCSLDDSAQFHGSSAILSHSSSRENLNLWLLNEHKLHVLEEGDWWQRQTGGRTNASP